MASEGDLTDDLSYHVLAIAHDDDPFVPIFPEGFINGNRPDMISRVTLAITMKTRKWFLNAEKALGSLAVFRPQELFLLT